MRSSLMTRQGHLAFGNELFHGVTIIHLEPAYGAENKNLCELLDQRIEFMLLDMAWDDIFDSVIFSLIQQGCPVRLS